MSAEITVRVLYPASDELRLIGGAAKCIKQLPCAYPHRQDRDGIVATRKAPGRGKTAPRRPGCRAGPGAPGGSLNCRGKLKADMDDHNDIVMSRSRDEKMRWNTRKQKRGDMPETSFHTHIWGFPHPPIFFVSLFQRTFPPRGLDDIVII